MSLDGDHWYRPDGSPCHSRIGANGKERSTTLADARKENLVPSVTTVLKVIAKPQLIRWLRNQDIIAAGNLPRHDDESDYQYIARVQEVSKQPVSEAADEGTNLHKAVEAAMSKESYPDRYTETVAAVKKELASLFSGVDDWVTEQTFASELGFGGAIDLHSPSTGIVVDWKSKSGPLDKRLAYDQNIQLAAYRQGLNLPISTAASVFISRDHPGVVKSHHWNKGEMLDGWLKFSHALSLWQLEKGYDPTFSREEAITA